MWGGNSNKCTGGNNNGRRNDNKRMAGTKTSVGLNEGGCDALAATMSMGGQHGCDAQVATMRVGSNDKCKHGRR